LFQNKTHPQKVVKEEIEQFLTWLAVKRRVSPSAQNKALQVILFLYRRVLKVDLPWLDDVVRAKEQQRVSVVLSREEVSRILSALRGQHKLIAQVIVWQWNEIV